MNWEETIQHARKTDAYKQVIELAYLEEDLGKNAERFMASEEFREVLRLIGKHTPLKQNTKNLKLLDIGAGNGISSIAFARSGFSVTAVEPDLSNTVGMGAITFLKEHYRLADLEVNTSYGESLPFADASFDIVYARQAMHHAHHLADFVKEAARVLKPAGLLVTCRDHVVNDATQKEEFLKNHPFQRFYGGENAFSLQEYRQAFSGAGLEIVTQLGHLDSVINYGPQSKKEIALNFKKTLEKKLGFSLPASNFLLTFIFRFFKWKTNNMAGFAGRLYSFVAKKS